MRSVEGAVLSIIAGTPKDAHDALTKLLQAQIELTDFAMGQPSLDEVFFALTGGTNETNRRDAT